MSGKAREFCSSTLVIVSLLVAISCSGSMAGQGTTDPTTALQERLTAEWALRPITELYSASQVMKFSPLRRVVASGLGDLTSRDQLMAAYLVAASDSATSTEMVAFSEALGAPKVAIKRVEADSLVSKAFSASRDQSRDQRVLESVSEVRLAFARTHSNAKDANAVFIVDDSTAASIVKAEAVLNDAMTPALAQSLVDRAVADCDALEPELRAAFNKLEIVALSAINDGRRSTLASSVTALGRASSADFLKSREHARLLLGQALKASPAAVKVLASCRADSSRSTRERAVSVLRNLK